MYNDLTGKRPKCSACRHQIFGAAGLFLCGAEIGVRADLSRQNAAVVRQIALEQIGRVQLIGQRLLHWPQPRQCSIFSISACMAGASQLSDGARRIIREMRAHWLIWIPAGQGRQ